MQSAREAIRHAIDASNLVASGEQEQETPEAAEERKNREAILQGLLHGRVVWSGSFWQDYLFYLKQTHMIHSVVTCHKLHPFSRSERLFALIAHLVASLGFTFMLLDDTGHKSGRPAILLAGFVTSLIMTVLHSVMVKVMKCACFQEGSRMFKWFGKRGRNTAEKCGHGVGWVLSLVSVLILFLGVQSGMDIQGYMEEPAMAWAYSQVSSAILTFTGATCIFTLSYWGFRWLPFCGDCCWRGQHGPDGSKPAGCYPHGPEYPKDLALFWDGDRFSCVKRGRCMAVPAFVAAGIVFAFCVAVATGMAFAIFYALSFTED